MQTQTQTQYRHSTDTDRQNLKKHPNVCFLTFNFYPLCHQFSMITFSDLLNPNEISPIPTQLVLSTRVFNHSSPFHLRRRLVPIFQADSKVINRKIIKSLLFLHLPLVWILVTPSNREAPQGENKKIYKKCRERQTQLRSGVEFYGIKEINRKN